MAQNRYYHYFVEGNNEEKIVKILKTDMQLIMPGKVQVFNVVEQRLSKPRIATLKPGTIVVLVFDTDTGNLSTLMKNIAFLNEEKTIKEVLCITQVKNLEDELIRSCDIKQIRELTGSKTNTEFKHDMLNDSNLTFCKKLTKYNFDFDKFWSMNDEEEYRDIPNDAIKIKLQ